MCVLLYIGVYDIFVSVLHAGVIVCVVNGIQVYIIVRDRFEGVYMCA